MPIESNKPSFKLGQAVLVRDCDGTEWVPELFAFLDAESDQHGFGLHAVYGGRRYQQCIPLEGNEILVGRKGKSPDKPDLDIQPARTYAYLEEVEVNVMGGDEDWEPAHYIRLDPTEGEPMPHQAVVDSEMDVHWFSDEDIRPKQG